jgi:hypothetical protein
LAIPALRLGITGGTGNNRIELKRSDEHKGNWHQGRLTETPAVTVDDGGDVYPAGRDVAMKVKTKGGFQEELEQNL